MKTSAVRRARDHGVRRRPPNPPRTRNPLFMRPLVRALGASYFAPICTPHLGLARPARAADLRAHLARSGRGCPASARRTRARGRRPDSTSRSGAAGTSRPPSLVAWTSRAGLWAARSASGSSTRPVMTKGAISALRRALLGSRARPLRPRPRPRAVRSGPGLPRRRRAGGPAPRDSDGPDRAAARQARATTASTAAATA